MNRNTVVSNGSACEELEAEGGLASASTTLSRSSTKSQAQ
jgi:hypothetical protein